MVIVDEDLWIKRTEQKSFLVYLVSDSKENEGWYNWMYHAVCHGDTEEELYADWLEQCKNIYGVDLSEYVKHQLEFNEDEDQCSYCIGHYRLAKSKLTDSFFSYGHSIPLILQNIPIYKIEI